jgi:glycosyltransferase involved in cell wall biosynthesis
MTRMAEKIILSIIIPLYNEEKGVAALMKALFSLKAKLPKKTELICVDDGSSDQTYQQLQKSQAPWPLKVIGFSRNFGHQSALLAGLQASKGTWVATMDADLQHPPQLLPTLLKLGKSGYDVVLTERRDTEKISFLKRLTSQGFYSLLNTISPVTIQPGGSDFRLLHRRVVDSLLALPEHRLFLRGMVTWLGFSVKVVPFTVRPRAHGTSHYTWRKMLRLAVDGIVSFSTLPLYLSAVLGALFTLAAVVYGVYVILTFLAGHAVPGWSSVILVVLGLGGVLSFLLSLIGLYLAAIYDEVKGRPPYVIRQTHQTTR